jgi:hypothetical protein
LDISVLSWTKQFHLSWRISLQSSTAPASMVLLFRSYSNYRPCCLSFWLLLLGFLRKVSAWVSFWFICGFVPLPRTFVLDLYVYYRIHQKRVLGLSVSLVPYLHQKRGGMYVLDLSVLGWTQQIDLQWCFSSCFYTPIIDACISLGFFAWFSLVSLPFGCAFSFLTLTDVRLEN